MSSSTRPSSDGFRPDLEGLRGVAILLVLAFHAGLPYSAGGFVGVDVFFVLSGFLITGLLLRELGRRGGIDLKAFYARRARRILPAAAVVLVATLAASALVLGPLDLERVAADGVAVALSVGNMRFAAGATDYFAASQTPSPLLHYWSLGVEEQFYLLWPALLLLVTRGPRPRLAAGITLLIVLVVSWAGAWYLTGVSEPWAFYALPTRAWQLALGGLLAVAARPLRRLPAWLVLPAGWAGLGAIAASAVLIGPTTPYPGLAALLPTLGAGGVVLSGDRRWSPGAVLALAPLRLLGRISYSLYLVHWPLLVLPAAGLAAGEQLPLATRLLLAGLAIPLAAASYRWVERPFHRGAVVARLPTGRVLAMALTTLTTLVLMAAAVDAGAAGIVGAYGESSSSAAEVASPAPLANLAPPPPPLATTGPGGGPTASGAPPTATLPTPAPSPSPGPPAGPQPLPRNVRPALGAAASDLDLIERNGCTIGNPAVQPADCVYGDPSGSTTIALVGDSHAAQWFPALEQIALARHWRLVPLTKLSCRFLDLRQYSRILQREYTECETWRGLVVRRLQTLKPDLVVVAVAGGMEPMTPADGSATVQGQAVARLLRQVPGRLAIIVDTPQSSYDVPACLAAHLADTRACATSRSVAFYHHWTLERTAAQLSGARLIDLSNDICPWDPCPAVLRGMIVYRDSFHLTATFSASLASALAAQLPDPHPLPAPTPSPTPPPSPAAAPLRWFAAGRPIPV